LLVLLLFAQIQFSLGQQSEQFLISSRFADTDPVASFTLSTNSTCVGDSIKFTNTSKTVGGTPIPLDIHWYFGDNIDTREPESWHKYWTPGTYTVSLVAFTTVGGVTTTDSVFQQITIAPRPEINFTLTGLGTNTNNDTIFAQGGSLRIDVNENYPNYIWTPNGETTSSITVFNTGVYSVFIVDNNGCKAKKSQNVIVKPLVSGDSATIIISNNILTPNNDGINDFLLIDKLEVYTNPIEIYIYNVWGDLVYSNTNYQNDWDATLNGKELDPGTYYFVITSKDKKGKIGYIDILR